MKHLTIISKSILLITVIIMVIGAAHAQTNEPQTDEIWRHKFAVGLGPEINKHSPQGFAGGLSLNFDTIFLSFQIYHHLLVQDFR